MELSFDNISLDKSLDKPIGTITNSGRNFYPGADELEDALGDVIIRYSHNGAFAFGGVSDEGKVIAISFDGNNYRYKILDSASIKNEGSFSLSGGDFSSPYDTWDKMNKDIISEIKGENNNVQEQ